jgi:hypothetical protein
MPPVLAASEYRASFVWFLQPPLEIAAMATQNVFKLVGRNPPMRQGKHQFGGTASPRTRVSSLHRDS